MTKESQFKECQDEQTQEISIKSISNKQMEKNGGREMDLADKVKRNLIKDNIHSWQKF